MKILSFMQRMPAGTLNVPMAVAASINSFFPDLLKLGGATTALFSTGTMTFIGLTLFLCGSQFKLHQIIPTLKRGFVLLLVKLIIAIVGSLILLQFLPPSGIWGIPVIAFVGALASTNPGMYLAICTRYGDNIDQAAFGLLNLISVPAIAIFCMGLASGSGFNIMVLLQILVPFLLGMITGNLDEQLSEYLKPGTMIIMPFMGFCFGTAIDLKLVVSAGSSALLLAALYVIVNVPILLFVDRYILRRPGYASFGVASAAAISITVPGLYASIDPVFEPFASVAAAQIAMVVVVTSFLMPAVAGYFGKRTEPGKIDKAASVQT